MGEETSNFIWDFIEEDMREGKCQSIRTRFPPEPNGYLHIGHCKALIADFGAAERFGGRCNLRFDDTNPAKEDTEYVDGIMQDIRWLGFSWDQLHYASEYYDKCYELAEDFIRRGVAYIDEQSQEEMRQNRGTLTEPGVNSPWRERPWQESLDLFRRMRAGEFDEGRMVLRAKIDMASPNINMRDPVMYRILKKSHHRTGDQWCIYPMYDYAHPIGDALEGVTHSLCSLEYEDHRPLYDWVVRQCGFDQGTPAPDGGVYHGPRQIEFARLNMTRTIMSKRYLRRLVEEGYVSGWDDPRMPTLCAMRRRGYPPEAIRDFVARVGLSKADSVVDAELLSHCVREALGDTAPRAMAVLDPLPVTLTNWPEGVKEELTVENHPDHPELGERTVTFGRHLYIEREDFMLDPPKKFFRLRVGGEVRLKGAYIIRCDEAVTDENGNVTELLCTVDMDTRSGLPGAERKVKGTLHFVSAQDCVPLTARLYEPLLLSDEDADEEGDKKDFISRLNPESLVEKHGYGERALKTCAPGDTYQFMRVGYFCCDPDSAPDTLVFNRVVGLKDSYQKTLKA